jgi:hypothetical protein
MVVEMSHTLRLDYRKDALRASRKSAGLHPSQAQEFETVSSFLKSFLFFKTFPCEEKVSGHLAHTGPPRKLFPQCSSHRAQVIRDQCSHGPRGPGCASS